MKLENIDVIEAQPFQRAVQAVDCVVHAERFIARRFRRLGADHHAVARHVTQRCPDHILGPVHRGGVDQGHAEVDRLADNAGRVAGRLPGAQAQLAEAAAAQTCDADLKAGAAECGVLHGKRLRK